MSGLRLEDVTVRFGGLTAVRGVSLVAAQGSVTGLIGPNGAGKTTTFNACCGTVPLASGTIELNGRVLSRLSPAARARSGLGRTFQRMQLCDRLTVAENVALGPEGMATGRRPWSQLWSGPGGRRVVLECADEAMERCGIRDLAGIRTGELSTGQRRFVELARALASPFEFLLLDEPSSGLDVVETQRFGDIVVDRVADRGIGVLLVEHDVALVRRICQRVSVLDFGQLLVSGSTTEVMSSEAVRVAYLGSTEVSASV
jgi:ABC-type branched-subunit amino acid transport system ATPase component